MSRRNGQIKKEFKMTARYGNEMGTYGARRQKVITLRRPLIIGALAAGVIALGASTRWLPAPSVGRLPSLRRCAASARAPA